MEKDPERILKRIEAEGTEWVLLLEKSDPAGIVREVMGLTGEKESELSPKELKALAEIFLERLPRALGWRRVWEAGALVDLRGRRVHLKAVGLTERGSASLRETLTKTALPQEVKDLLAGIRLEREAWEPGTDPDTYTLRTSASVRPPLLRVRGEGLALHLLDGLEGKALAWKEVSLPRKERMNLLLPRYPVGQETLTLEEALSLLRGEALAKALA
ncbi:MAG: hypothetical protein ABDH20_13145 [Thermus sp.]